MLIDKYQGMTLKEMKQAKKDKANAKAKAYRDANKKPKKAKKTEAEKKEARAVYMKAYNITNRDKIAKQKKGYKLANKEKIAKTTEKYLENTKEERAIKAKVYNESNKENIAKRGKAYNEANNESILSKKKTYREANKETLAEKNKVYNESKKLPYNIVYCIPDYNGNGDNYAGVTNQPEIRMRGHKSDGRINTDKWYELERIVDRAEAEAKEKEYHSLGYHGDSQTWRQSA